MNHRYDTIIQPLDGVQPAGNAFPALHRPPPGTKRIFKRGAAARRPTRTAMT